MAELSTTLERAVPRHLLSAILLALCLAGCCAPASKPAAEPNIETTAPVKEPPDVNRGPDLRPAPDRQPPRLDGDRKRLEPHFAKQETPYSCSMASARMVIAGLTGKKVREASLRKRSRVGADGMTVSKLAALLRGRPYRLKVDKVHRPKVELLDRTLRQVLVDPGAFIIARFLMDDGSTHHSPIGALEPKGRGVFILDVDTGPRWETWDSFSKRFRTMETGFVVVRNKE